MSNLPSVVYINNHKIKAFSRLIAEAVPKIKNQANNPVDFNLAFYKYLYEALYTISKLEKKLCNTNEIAEALKPLHDLMGLSKFIQRTQTWPRGYPGDFETIEYMYFSNNQNDISLETLIDKAVLNLPICQQHRNKINYQADVIYQTASQKRNSSILILACGGSIDLGLVQDQIAHHEPEIIINDMDQDALKFSLNRCKKVKKIEPIEGNALRAMYKLRNYKKFDLIVAGGLFDYLDDKFATSLMKLISYALNPNGKFIFTNIIENNPFQAGMRYLAHWELIGRSKKQIQTLAHNSGFNEESIQFAIDNTGLARLITLYAS
jgi:SAM-dependent methyltransferase